MTHPILELQTADTTADQLRHRRSHLPEQQRVDAAAAALGAWEARRGELQRRIDDLEAVIAEREGEAHQIDEQRTRLERQMKTIIAPREAEALQHQIATLTQRRSDLDDVELEALEAQAAVDEELTAHAPSGDAVRAELEAAEAAAVDATGSINAELADIAERLDALRAAVDPALLRRYDQARRHQMVAVAKLNRHRCEGCHLDLSAAEVDDVRAGATDGIGDCPACGRMLVL